MSSDNGLTWNKLADPVEDTGESNPPAMVKLKDGGFALYTAVGRRHLVFATK